MTNRRQKDSYSVRIFLLILCSATSVVFLTARLFALQVVSHVYYENLAENQHQLNRELVAQRGEIFIRDRYSEIPYPVVTNINKPLLYVVPQQVTDASELSRKLADALGLDRKEVFEKVSDRRRKYIPIAKQVQESVAERLASEHLPGVFFEDETHQRYAEGKLAANVLGFVAFEGDKRTGRYGLEHYFERELAGTPGKLRGVTDPSGIWITGGRDLTPAEDGADLILTLDRTIQYKVEEVLEKAVTQHQAKSGSVVVLNPKTGAVLAMASYPTFDPNEFNKVEDPAVYNNMAIHAAYEPGSVMKAITFAASLQEGGITPDMTFEDPGAITLENFTIRNSENKKYGQVTMTHVLEESINMGSIFAEQKISHKKFTEYLEAFGFGKLTGVTLPFEKPGSIANIYRGGDLYPATISFGQGMTATPLQLVSAFSVIANGGKLFKPYIVEQKSWPDGRTESINPEMVREIISSHTASTLAAMLVSVVERGHGKRAGVPGYFIAGKTGTAQVAYENRSGYDPNRSIGTFVGFGPVDNPVFTMIVKIDEPQDIRFAETTAAPAFGEIAQFILNYYQVPKSR